MDRVEAHYVAQALQALEDAEASGVLASTGDRPALAAIGAVLARLEALHHEFDDEFGEFD